MSRGKERRQRSNSSPRSCPPRGVYTIRSMPPTSSPVKGGKTKNNKKEQLMCPPTLWLSSPPTVSEGEYPGISVRNIVGVICNNAATPTPHPRGPQPEVCQGPDNYPRYTSGGAVRPIVVKTNARAVWLCVTHNIGTQCRQPSVVVG